MNRDTLERYLSETYGVDGDCPWKQYPHYTVYRHRTNQKWFAVLMELSPENLGLSGSGKLHVINLKCDPLLIGSLRMKPGFYPAYHMNKDLWISAALNDCVSDEELKTLIEWSFDATAKGKKNR